MNKRLIGLLVCLSLGALSYFIHLTSISSYGFNDVLLYSSHAASVSRDFSPPPRPQPSDIVKCGLGCSERTVNLGYVFTLSFLMKVSGVYRIEVAAYLNLLCFLLAIGILYYAFLGFNQSLFFSFSVILALLLTPRFMLNQIHPGTDSIVLLGSSLLALIISREKMSQWSLAAVLSIAGFMRLTNFFWAPFLVISPKAEYKSMRDFFRSSVLPGAVILVVLLFTLLTESSFSGSMQTSNESSTVYGDFFSQKLQRLFTPTYFELLTKSIKRVVSEEVFGFFFPLSLVLSALYWKKSPLFRLPWLVCLIVTVTISIFSLHGVVPARYFLPFLPFILGSVLLGAHYIFKSNVGFWVQVVTVGVFLSLAYSNPPKYFLNDFSLKKHSIDWQTLEEISTEIEENMVVGTNNPLLASMLSGNRKLVRVGLARKRMDVNFERTGIPMPDLFFFITHKDQDFFTTLHPDQFSTREPPYTDESVMNLDDYETLKFDGTSYDRTFVKRHDSHKIYLYKKVQ